MKRIVIPALLLLVALPAFAMSSRKTMPPVEDKRLEGSFIHAPDFPAHLDWLNTDHKISLKDLKGKIVLLDFWTYCCINCMHIIPDLKKLEEKYPNELVVIGVHSAKFYNEKETDSIRHAIMRYGIKHPVINDRDLEVWESYAVNAWPTLILINPDGRIIGEQSGENIFELFDGLIAQAIRYYDQKGILNRKPLIFAPEESKRPQTVLSFPGKIRADRAKKVLFISDSNHNRILITDPEGRIQDVIGSGKEGQEDGSFESVELNHPQGVFPEGDFLYIADTENHLIREANLKTREVKTLFGTGEKARGIGGHGIGTNVALNSPWDLIIHKNVLYIAMAGSHQIYSADLKTQEIQPYAGSGNEARVDGVLLQAALAQPSGITTNGLRLFFADSEVSSVRSADLDPKGNVETVIGKDLFVYGDVDGADSIARLQHALGVEFDEKYNQLYVADTYNSKIKIIEPFKKTSVTFAGTGKHGLTDGNAEAAQFFEPGGLTLLDGKLYVADTNNHQIRVVDTQTKQVSTLTLSGLDRLARRTLNPFKGRTVGLKPQSVGEGRALIKLLFELPKGYHFNEEAPFHIEWKSSGRNVAFTSQSNQLDHGRFSAPIEIAVNTRLGSEDLIFEAVIYYCKDDSKICLFDHVRVHVPAVIKPKGPSSMEVRVKVQTKG